MDGRRVELIGHEVEKVHLERDHHYTYSQSDVVLLITMSESIVMRYFDHILMLLRLSIKIFFESEDGISYQLTKINNRDFG